MRPARNNDEIIMSITHRLSPHGSESHLKFQQPGIGQFEFMLVAVDGYFVAIVLARCAAHLDMRSQHVSDVPTAGEGHGAIYAGLIGRKFVDRHIEPTGIKRIARQQQSAMRIEDHDVRGFMTRRWYDIKNTPTKINMADGRGQSATPKNAATAAGSSPTTVVSARPVNSPSP